MKIKEWKFNQIMSDVCGYGDLWMNLSCERDAEKFDTPKVDENGYCTFTCRAEILKETEKAVYVELGDSWKTWIPKSCIA